MPSQVIQIMYLISDHVLLLLGIRDRGIGDGRHPKLLFLELLIVRRENTFLHYMALLEIKYGFIRFANHCILFLFTFFSASQLFWNCSMYLSICISLMLMFIVRGFGFSTGANGHVCSLQKS